MLILMIIVFGLAIGWVAQLILGMGGKLSGVTLFAGLAGSFVGGIVISLLSGDGLNIPRAASWAPCSGRSSCSRSTAR